MVVEAGSSDMSRLEIIVEVVAIGELAEVDDAAHFDKKGEGRSWLGLSSRTYLKSFSSSITCTPCS